LRLLHEQVSPAKLFWCKSAMAKSRGEIIRGGFWQKKLVRSLRHT
jgi:hypothetical protein